MDKGCRIGRNYEAFQSFMENNPDTAIVQMDSVIGAKGGKCLLTVHFVETSLMLAFLRESNTSQSVIDVYNNLDKSLGREHINSYKRKKLNNRSPYETFSFYHGEEVLKKLGCSPVPADEILLKPTLLKR